MKKAFALISLLYYSVASFGLVVDTHYCMKRVVSVRVYEIQPKACGRCGMNIHKGNHCCYNERMVVMLTQDQTRVSSHHFNFNSATPAIDIHPEFQEFIHTSFTQPVIQSDHAPPWLATKDVYLRNRVFRI
jgi:hypothetical protein